MNLWTICDVIATKKVFVLQLLHKYKADSFLVVKFIVTVIHPPTWVTLSLRISLWYIMARSAGLCTERAAEVVERQRWCGAGDGERRKDWVDRAGPLRTYSLAPHLAQR